jgi:hypothetical protein
VRRTTEWIAGLILALLASGNTAAAQTGARQEPIDCGANVGRRQTCDADTSAGVVLIAQEGDASCAIGQT